MVLVDENGGFNVDIQNISEIYFQQTTADHFHKLTHKRIHTHSYFQKRRNIGHGLLQHIFGDDHTTFAHGLRYILQGFRLFVDEEYGGIAHGFEHAIEDKNVLKEAIGIQIVVGDRGSTENDDFSVCNTL